MRRRLLNLLTALSLLLCVAAVVLWVRSYWHYDAVGFWPSHQQNRVYGLLSDSGTFCLATSVEGRTPAQPAWEHYEAAPGRIALSPTYAGFVFRSNSQDLIVGAPYWVACLIGTAPAAVLLWWAKSRRRHAELRGLCRVCGYDLRATPDRCPECGTTATVSA